MAATLASKEVFAAFEGQSKVSHANEMNHDLKGAN